MTDGVGVHELIVTAAIIIGFGVTAFMFRVERETRVQDDHIHRWRIMHPGEEPKQGDFLRLRFSGADCLIFFSVFLAGVSVIELLARPGTVEVWQKSLAAILNIGAVILLLGYIPATLAHYGISIGEPKTTEKREQWEKMESWFVYVSFTVAVAVMVVLAFFHACRK
jgi:hypothetical protein